MQFDLVSPERRLASLEVSSVQIPGADGDLTAMPGHAPVITNLRPGILKVEAPSGNTDYVVTGGFAEIINNQIPIFDKIDQNLSLDGMRIIYNLNKK